MIENQQPPKLICLTPVKNEAWCLDVFLQCTSLWADYIIIADQGSTDGSREIALKYPKVILLENDGNGLDEPYRQKILFEEARKIKGNRIIFALDADELFTGNFINTSDWETITTFKAGNVFVFHWATVETDQIHYWEPQKWFQWAFHDDGTQPIQSGYIHVARVPWPENVPATEICIKDFQVLHLVLVNWQRMLSKERFYAFVIRVNEPKKSVISLNRQYAYFDNSAEKKLPIPNYFLDFYKQNGIDVFGSLVLNESFFWFDEQILNYFDQYGVEKFKYLDMWDASWVKKMQEHRPFKVPKTILSQLLFMYLRATHRYRSRLIIRAFDKILKQII
ncbi:MAG: glycosyltransferase family 2 protein [Microbacter sp.]